MVSADVNITVFMVYKTKISILFITEIAQYSCLYEILSQSVNQATTGAIDDEAKGEGKGDNNISDSSPVNSAYLQSQHM